MFVCLFVFCLLACLFVARRRLFVFLSDRSDGLRPSVLPFFFKFYYRMLHYSNVILHAFYTQIYRCFHFNRVILHDLLCF
jgi:hypothetical protein